jgi:hypothetical protein
VQGEIAWQAISTEENSLRRFIVVLCLCLIAVGFSFVKSEAASATSSPPCWVGDAGYCLHWPDNYRADRTSVGVEYGGPSTVFEPATGRAVSLWNGQASINFWYRGNVTGQGGVVCGSPIYVKIRVCTSTESTVCGSSSWAGCTYLVSTYNEWNGTQYVNYGHMAWAAVKLNSGISLNAQQIRNDPCHELGHTLGLAHTGGDFNNQAGGDPQMDSCLHWINGNCNVNPCVWTSDSPTYADLTVVSQQNGHNDAAYFGNQNSSVQPKLAHKLARARRTAGHDPRDAWTWLGKQRFEGSKPVVEVPANAVKNLKFNPNVVYVTVEKGLDADVAASPFLIGADPLFG